MGKAPTMDDSPGEEHTAFTQWAVSHGIKIKGIAPARFPGRRLGMIATRDIEENEIMLSIPVSLMLTIDSIPESFASMFPAETSIHGVLAAFLTHGDPGLLAELDAWRSVWPDWAEFESSMPVFWPARLRRSNSSVVGRGDSVSEGLTFLPPSISGLWDSFEKLAGPEDYEYETRYQNLLAQQEKRLQDAWKHVLSVFPETDWKAFAYNWAIINSRSFYYVSPGKDEPEDWNDAIGMVPYADYFNHVDDAACDVTFNGKKYTFKATRRYDKGEEIYMSYGSHSNDFLLVEYGFYLDNNPSDGVYLDDIILKDLTPSEKEELAGQDCLGNFEITPSGADTNAVAAAGLKYMDRQDWREYVAGASENGLDARKTADIIGGWVAKYLQECEVTINCLSEGSTESEAEKEKLDSILARWKQIQQLCETAVNAVNAIAQ